MVELGEDLGVELVDVIGDLPEAGDHLGMVDVDQLLIGHVGGVNRQLLGDNETGAPLGPLAPVIHVAFTGQIFFRQIRQVRLEGNAVLHFRLADLQG